MVLPERDLSVRTRKPRTTGADLDFDGAHQFGQEIWQETPAVKKLDRRRRAGLCPGCGFSPCKCKSTSKKI